MPRILSERDVEIFRKTAPDFTKGLCPGSGSDFKSVLPPLSNHISKSAEDFKERISKLSEEDWKYLITLILSGEESISCLSEEAVESVLYYINKISFDDARRIRTIYDLESCGMI